MVLVVELIKRLKIVKSSNALAFGGPKKGFLYDIQEEWFFQKTTFTTAKYIYT